MKRSSEIPNVRPYFTLSLEIFGTRDLPIRKLHCKGAVSDLLNGISRLDSKCVIHTGGRFLGHLALLEDGRANSIDVTFVTMEPVAFEARVIDALGKFVGHGFRSAISVDHWTNRFLDI